MHELKAQIITKTVISERNQLQKKPLNTFFKHIRAEKDKTHTHKQMTWTENPQQGLEVTEEKTVCVLGRTCKPRNMQRYQGGTSSMV